MRHREVSVVNIMKTHSGILESDRIGFGRYCIVLARRALFFSIFLLACLLIWASAPVTSALASTPATVPAASATSIVGKTAELNGTPMSSGATLFPGDVVRLGQASTVALRFGSSLVLAAPLTELVIEPQGVTLRNGRLQVRANGENAFGISGPFFHVNVAALGGLASSAEIRLGGKRAQVSAVAGTADLTAAGIVAPYTLHAGESATLDATGADAPAPQAASNPGAGEVTRLTPQVQIDRDAQHSVATVFERIYWNDGLRSGPTGRAHLTLNDGSQLNLGSDSSLRVLQHDAQAQQTSLDLLVGRLRGKITKLTRPGAKFEIHTPLGVAGLVGTDLALSVTDDYTDLMVFEGEVRFTALNGQAYTVTTGMHLLISKLGVVQGPRPTTPQEAQTAQNLTDVTTTPIQGTAIAASRPIMPLVVTLSGIAAGVGIGVYEGTRPTVSNSVP
jgi:ferric-dicitrate binding protein FerR (iron transport regulator)